MDEKQRNFQKIQKFCQTDVKIKEILYNLAPDERFKYDEDYKINLSDKMFDGLKEIKYYLNNVLDDFNMKEYKSHLNNLLDKYSIELAEASTDFSKLKTFYKNNLSDMNPDIIKETGEVCVGYTSREEERLNLSNKTTTINEFLHVLHSNIINTFENYQDLPVVSKELSQWKEPCVLYGIDNSLGKNILSTVSAVKDIGETSIINLSDNQMIMMIRDKGHALTIQINRNEDESFNVKYFIPKLCNDTMINNLKGVTPVNENSHYTVGSFDVEEKGLGVELLYFISNVPTDSNMNTFIEIEQGIDRTEHYDLYRIFEEMEFPYLAKVIKANPVLYEAEGFKDYLQERYDKDLDKAQNAENEAIRDKSSVEEVKKLISETDKIQSAGKELGFYKEVNENGVEFK